MKKYLLLCSALVVASSAYAEINCSVRPTCSDLGYTQTETACEGKFILKCPFDETAVFCGGETTNLCVAQGYTEQDGTIPKSCGIGYEKKYCPSDETYYKCTEMTAEEKCVAEGYTQITSGSNLACVRYYNKEYCSYDSTYYKCVEMTAQEKCELQGFSTSASCLLNAVKQACVFDTTYIACISCDDLGVDGVMTSTSASSCEYGYTTDDIYTTCYRCCTEEEAGGTTSGGATSLTKCFATSIK